MIDIIDRKVEYAKAVADYFKHLTTLSTGAIILIPAFLEKVFTNPVYRGCVTLSLIGFIASVVGTTTVYSLHLMLTFPRDEKDGATVGLFTAWVLIVGLIAAWGGFLVGIVSLGVFAINNLDRLP